MGTVMKQKSTSRLLFSPASSGARMSVQSPTSSSSSARFPQYHHQHQQNPSMTANSNVHGGSSPGGGAGGSTSPGQDGVMRLGRKASFSSLVDAETRREREREEMREFRERESQIAGVVANTGKGSTVSGERGKSRRTRTALASVAGSPSSAGTGAGAGGSRPPSVIGGDIASAPGSAVERPSATRTATIGYSAPTASSRARLQSTISNASAGSGTSSRPSSSAGVPGSVFGTVERERENRPSLVGLFYPPHPHPSLSTPTSASSSTPTLTSASASASTSTLSVPRPTTPSQSPSVLRLTMPTSSTLAKARTKSGASPRINVANVFGGSGEDLSVQRERTGSVSPGPGSSPHPRVTSPTFSISGPSSSSSSGSKIRNSLASAASRRTSIGLVAGSGGGTISRGLATGTALGARLIKASKTFGDGTELDGFEDLVVEKEKERKYRVSPKVAGRVVSAGSSASSASLEKKNAAGAGAGASATGTGTIGRRTPTGIPMASSHSVPSVSSTTGAVAPKRPPSSAAVRSDAGQYLFPHLHQQSARTFRLTLMKLFVFSFF